MSRTRVPLVAGNWKMNLNHLEAMYFIQQFTWLMRNAHYDYEHSAEIAICPSFTSIRSVQVLLQAEKAPIRIGAQNVSPISGGAFTGDISADMLKQLDCRYVIIGHSEQRKYHPEDDANLINKVRAVLVAGIQPILCVGESTAERSQGIELEYAIDQVSKVTRDLSDEEVSQLIIAYEPLWAIGGTGSASPQIAQNAAAAIRQYLLSIYGNYIAQKVRIIYGGSVNSANVVSLMQGPDVDGFLIGGASLKPDEFSKIARLVTIASTQRDE